MKIKKHVIETLKLTASEIIAVTLWLRLPERMRELP